jgi:large subunit ribosomal protein L9
MRVILNKDVKDLGKAGDLVEVSEGYGRNFLFPRSLAAEATAGALKQWEERKAAEERKQARLLAEAKEFAKELEQAKIVVSAKSGDGGKLYGTITTKEIGEAIAKQTAHAVDKRKIELQEHIKTLGVHPFVLRLHPQVIAHMKVIVQEL